MNWDQVQIASSSSFSGAVCSTGVIVADAMYLRDRKPKGRSNQMLLFVDVQRGQVQCAIVSGDARAGLASLLTFVGSDPR